MFSSLCLIVCSFVCLLVCLFGCSCVCLFVRSCVIGCVFVCLFICLIAYWFDGSLVRVSFSFDCVFACLSTMFVRWVICFADRLIVLVKCIVVLLVCSDIV